MHVQHNETFTNQASPKVCMYAASKKSMFNFTRRAYNSLKNDDTLELSLACQPARPPSSPSEAASPAVVEMPASTAVGTDNSTLFLEGYARGAAGAAGGAARGAPITKPEKKRRVMHFCHQRSNAHGIFSSSSKPMMR